MSKDVGYPLVSIFFYVLFVLIIPCSTSILHRRYQDFVKDPDRYCQGFGKDPHRHFQCHHGHLFRGTGIKIPGKPDAT